MRSRKHLCITAWVRIWAQAVSYWLAELSFLEPSDILCNVFKQPSAYSFFFSLSTTDEEVASLNMIKSAPVGPVAGGIMGCIMVLVLAVYAYRHQIHRRSHQHMSPLAAQGRTDGWTLSLKYTFLSETFQLKGQWNLSKLLQLFCQ